MRKLIGETWVLARKDPNLETMAPRSSFGTKEKALEACEEENRLLTLESREAFKFKVRRLRRYVQKKGASTGGAKIARSFIPDDLRPVWDECVKLSGGEFIITTRVRDPMAAMSPCGAVRVGQFPVVVAWYRTRKQHAASAIEECTIGNEAVALRSMILRALEILRRENGGGGARAGEGAPSARGEGAPSARGLP